MRTRPEISSLSDWADDHGGRASDSHGDSRAVALGDVTGDGKLDVLIVNKQSGAASTRINFLYTNSGASSGVSEDISSSPAPAKPGRP